MLSFARYGKVVGGRGSVVPLFLQQPANGSITVTDERMTRFWITLTHGVEFVLRGLGMMRGGEIFVPKIPSTTIMDVASAIAPGSKVKFTGVRPGEKLHEILISPDEARQTWELPDMFIVHPPEWGKEKMPEGVCEVLPDDFRYASDNNSQWLTTEDIKAMAAEL